MTTNDERPAQRTPSPQPGLLSPECRDGRHGYQCSRNPRRMPSWPPLPVCECACHDTHDTRHTHDAHDARRAGAEEASNG